VTKISKETQQTKIKLNTGDKTNQKHGTMWPKSDRFSVCYIDKKIQTSNLPKSDLLSVITSGSSSYMPKMQQLQVIDSITEHMV